MQRQAVQIEVGDGRMPAYLARPSDDRKHPAIVVLEGLYGFDEELRRITDMVATVGFVGLAINYFHRTHPEFKEPFTPEGRARGAEATKSIRAAQVRTDLEAARDWLIDQSYVDLGKIAAWGFGFGGAAAFYAACMPGYRAVAAFYGQSIGKPLPGGDPAPVEDAKKLRAPLLLVFGGRDELIGNREIESLTDALKNAGKKYEVQLYRTVGHSFFREYQSSAHAAEIADAWDRVQAFFKRNLN